MESLSLAADMSTQGRRLDSSHGLKRQEPDVTSQRSRHS